MTMQNVQGVKEEPNAFMGSGRTTISGANTATQLTATSTACRKVWVSCDPAAGVEFAVGDSNIGSGAGSWRGVVLYPGHPGIPIVIDNLTKVYFCGAAGAIACYTYYV